MEDKLISEAYRKGLRTERNRIINLIKKDIEFQSSKLKHDFESDKAIEWRLTSWFFVWPVRSLSERICFTSPFFSMI